LAWAPARRGRAGPHGGVQGAQAPAGVRGWPRAARQRGPLWGVEGGAAPLTSLGAGCRRRPDASMLAKRIASGTAPRTANPEGLHKYALLTSVQRAGAGLAWHSLSLSPALPGPEPTSSIRQLYPATFTSARACGGQLRPWAGCKVTMTFPANPTDLPARAGSSSERGSFCPSPHPDPKLRGEVGWREIELLNLHPLLVLLALHGPRPRRLSAWLEPAPVSVQ
jgi:hypothetical protein